MVDGVVLLVDAAEGPLPQTKFVLTKALKLGLKPIVLINKVDRSDARPQEVLNEVFDLFSALDADEAQLDFPILHACGREGWAVGDGWKVGDVGKDLKPLFNVISRHIPPPKGSIDAPMQMLVSLLDADNFLGRIVVGRVHNGCVRVNMPVKVLSRDGQYKELGRLTKLFSFRGNVRVPIQGQPPRPLLASLFCIFSVPEPLLRLLVRSFFVAQAPMSATSSPWLAWWTPASLRRAAAARTHCTAPVAARVLFSHHFFPKSFSHAHPICIRRCRHSDPPRLHRCACRSADRPTHHGRHHQRQ